MFKFPTKTKDIDIQILSHLLPNDLKSLLLSFNKYLYSLFKNNKFIFNYINTQFSEFIPLKGNASYQDLLDLILSDDLRCQELLLQLIAARGTVDMIYLIKKINIPMTKERIKILGLIANRYNNHDFEKAIIYYIPIIEEKYESNGRSDRCRDSQIPEYKLNISCHWNVLLSENMNNSVKNFIKLLISFDVKYDGTLYDLINRVNAYFNCSILDYAIKKGFKFSKEYTIENAIDECREKHRNFYITEPSIYIDVLNVLLSNGYKLQNPNKLIEFAIECSGDWKYYIEYYQKLGYVFSHEIFCSLLLNKNIERQTLLEIFNYMTKN